MIRIVRNLYLPLRFFYAAGAVIVLFIFSFIIPWLFPVAQTALVILIAILVVDTLLLNNAGTKVQCSRDMAKLLSLGSDNKVKLTIENQSGIPLKVSVIDELPFQLQKRDFNIHLKLQPKEKKILSYDLRPLVRGEYAFGKVHTFIRSIIGFAERRCSHNLEKNVPVYPSIIEMKQYELISLSQTSYMQGVKKIRRLGHSYEFEQIKEYVKGDDYQSVNWKATSRVNRIMVNHYEDERSQQIYCLVDKSRSMRMPFNGLSLLDHAINTSLVIANTAINKQDKAGLITFSDKIDSALKADRQRNQLKMILEALYKQKEGNLEANYELMYRVIKNFIKGRSLIFLYTNFESSYALQRALPIIRKINQLHLLVVVFFKNTEIIEYSKHMAEDMEQIYLKTIAQSFVSEKNQIANELRQYGIQTILTKPEELSINSVNKYLELKARGMI
ncbi:DUF58 domain-containing protein [Fulvivirgaceae bacterium BMA10]|uniref:DUF58 domain-containing protein n=1 Tax=Splendidivirga corallicola TaxID=3051826 RepID=A0ABT8KVH5_9BACT|nr:DUF58 domain-containing protein [Fulvivirgaceae bacterium BMA10]